MSIEQWSDLLFSEAGPRDGHAYGSVRAVNEDGSYMVQLNASNTLTRCAPFCTAMVGDRVKVVINANGKCDAIGRLGGDLGGGGGSIAGQVFAYAGTDTPQGCLPCDGSEVSRFTYSELFNAIGTTYGEGNGVTTFNLPNLEGRVIVGEGTGESGTEYALGAAGGEEKHAQTVEELASHKHAVKSGGTTASSGVYAFSDHIVSTSTVSATYRYLDAMDYEGGGQPFNVMQPYIVLRWFISTGKGGSPGSTGGGSEGGSSSDADEKIAILEEALTASLKSKTWVFGLRDRGNQEKQAGTVVTGWQGTTVGSVLLAGSGDWDDYLSINGLSYTLKKPGVYRCVFRIHAQFGGASRLGAAWFDGSLEASSDWIYAATTQACTAVTELIVNVESDYSITPKIYAGHASYTKYMGGHLTNFTIEYLGDF